METVESLPSEEPGAQMQLENRCILRMIQVLGIVHIVVAFVICCFGIVVLAEFNLNKELNAHAMPVWSMLGFITTGVLGIALFKKPQNQALAIFHVVFAILSVLLSLGIIIASSLGVEKYNCVVKTYFNIYINRNITRYYPSDCRSKTIRNIGEPIYGMLIALGTLEFIFSILSTIFSLLQMCHCGGDCCKECATDCKNCCEYQDSASQSYQMMPVNRMNQQQQQQPSFVPPHYQHSSQAYPPMQIPIQQVNVPFNSQPQIVSSSSGQQFILMPIPQMQPISVPSTSAMQGENQEQTLKEVDYKVDIVQ